MRQGKTGRIEESEKKTSKLCRHEKVRKIAAILVVIGEGDAPGSRVRGGRKGGGKRRPVWQGKKVEETGGIGRHRE